MAFLIVTVYGIFFYAIRAPKGKFLYALLGSGVGALSVTFLFAVCYYMLGFRMTGSLDFILAIVGGIITHIVGIKFVKTRLSSS